MKFPKIDIENFGTIRKASLALADRGLVLIQGVNEVDTSADSNATGRRWSRACPVGGENPTTTTSTTTTTTVAVEGGAGSTRLYGARRSPTRRSCGKSTPPTSPRQPSPATS